MYLCAVTSYRTAIGCLIKCWSLWKLIQYQLFFSLSKDDTGNDGKKEEANAIAFRYRNNWAVSLYSMVDFWCWYWCCSVGSSVRVRAMNLSFSFLFVFLYVMELHTICVCVSLCARVCVPSSMRLTAHHAIIASLHFRLSNQFTHNFIVLHKMDIYTIAIASHVVVVVFVVIS